MSAQRRNTFSVSVYETIGSLVESNDWDRLAKKLDQMDYQVCVADRRLIMQNMEAPDWLKNIAYRCSMVASA
jgi:hypothetical protein